MTQSMLHCIVKYMGPVQCYVMQSGDVSDFLEKNVTKMYGSMLLALRGSGWVYNFQKKSVTLHLNGPDVLVHR